METQQRRRRRSGTHEGARVYVALRDDSGEWRLDREVLLQRSDGLHLRLRRLCGIFIRPDERLRGLNVLLRDDDVILGNHAWRRGSRFQPVVRALGGRQLGRRFSALPGLPFPASGQGAITETPSGDRAEIVRWRGALAPPGGPQPWGGKEANGNGNRESAFDV